ncbi:large neutral amino acids transporter small subunit 4-like [Diadema antillarum]|uniref:large neutral amino acids transporter small subunit 4-like n=1 Tax=Diadema antillarum TaxID=105358 RepID=UPI003A83D2C4
MKLPTLETANKRRYWLVGTMIVENLFFSAVLLGWSSLLPVLLSEGFYSTKCKEGDQLDGNSTGHGAANTTDVQFYDEDGTTMVYEDSSLGATTLPEENPYGRPTYPRCSGQDEALNLAFTIGSFLLSGLTFPIGMAMDKFGSRLLRMIGAFMFIASCLIFGWTPIDMSYMIIPAVSLNGVGGIMITFTSFQIANLFGTKRSTVISLNIGSYASAAILFLILKGLYDAGVSRSQMFTGLACATLFVVINCFFNIPKEPIPDPEGSAFGMHWQILKINHKVTGKQFYSMVTNVGRKLSITDEAAEEAKQTMIRKGSKIYSSQLNLAIELKERKKKRKEKTLLHSICSPIYLLSLIVMCITQLRLLLFIGSLTQMLQIVSGNDVATVDQYIYFFGLMQIMCLVTSPLIGLVMDFRIKEVLQAAKNKERRSSRRESTSTRRESLTKKPSFSNGDSKRPSIISLNGLMNFANGDARRPSNGSVANGHASRINSTGSDVELGLMGMNGQAGGVPTKVRHPSTSSTSSNDSQNPKPPMSLKIRKLYNSSYAFFITGILIMFFGVTVLIPNLQVQIISFILHTIIRGFIHSSVCGLYAITYPASQVGSLIGLQSLISACATLLQYPIFVAIEGPLNRDPFYVNVTLLAISVLNFGLPIYMFYLAKKLRRKQMAEQVPDEQKLIRSPTNKSALETVPEHV